MGFAHSIIAPLRFIKPRKLDSYIFVETIAPLFGGVLFFTFIFLMFQALRLAEFFIVRGVSGVILLKMICLLILSFLPTSLPIAFLIGVLAAFRRLSADSELVAMKANGIGLLRLSLPVQFLAVITVVLSLALNLEWVPWGNREFKKLLMRVSNTKVVGAISEGTFTAGFFDLLIYADKVDKKNNKMQKVFLFDEREAKTPLAVVANAGEVIPVKPKTEFGSAAVLRLTDGNIHRHEDGTEAYQRIKFNSYDLFLQLDEGEEAAAVKPKMMSFGALSDGMKKYSDNTKEGLEFRTEYWKRYAVAVAPIVFLFFGVGYGTIRTRGFKAGAALIALIVVFTYWGALSVLSMMVQNSQISPWLGMLIPNLIFFAIGLRAFQKASW